MTSHGVTLVLSSERKATSSYLQLTTSDSILEVFRSSDGMIMQPQMVSLVDVVLPQRKKAVDCIKMVATRWTRSDQPTLPNQQAQYLLVSRNSRAIDHHSHQVHIALSINLKQCLDTLTHQVLSNSNVTCQS